MQDSSLFSAHVSTMPKGYRPRIADARIHQLLTIFGAVEIRGTKWCGKTWSALAAGESVTHVDLPGTTTLIEADPRLALEGARPHVIDEWQEVPAIWDVVRHEIDNAGSERGLFILTGSSTPQKDKVHHSGAGRIARVDMSTLSLWERGISSGRVSLGKLFDHSFSACATEELGLSAYANIICSGGWPALSEIEYRQASEIVTQYLEAFFEVSVPKKGGQPSTARRLARSLARNVAASATYKTLAADALYGYSGESSEKAPADSTVSFYLDLFKQLYLIEELSGWDAPVRSPSRVRTKPKRYFADPSLAASLLGIGPDRLLQDGQLMGLLFESLCIHDLRIYAAALDVPGGAKLSYYHDSDGLEVDCIIELPDGAWAGIEIKLGEDKVPDGIRSLSRLRRRVESNPGARNPRPVFMAMLTANSPFARYDHENDVYILPLSALKP